MTFENRYMLGHRLLVDGKYRRAVRALAEVARDDPDDLLVRLELACALAGASRVGEAKRIIDPIDSSMLSSSQRVRYLTASAWIRARAGDGSDSIRILEEAHGLDKSFILPAVSLARHWALNRSDFSRSHEYLADAMLEVGQSPWLVLHQVAIAIDAKDYGLAYEVSMKAVRNLGFSLKLGSAALMSWLLRTPREGFPVVALLSMLTFVPSLGPTWYAVWSITSIVLVWSLRKYSPRSVGFVMLYWLTFTGVFAGRWILWGTAFP